MTVSTVTAPQTPAIPQVPPPAKGKGPAINSDFDTFLKMLTAQLKSQDPLNPMDSSQFAVQLATFSGVEQQMKTNDLLQGLGGQLGVMGMSDLAGWVGKQARAAMPVWFDGNPVPLAPEADSLATSAQLVVRNATGAVVARETVPHGTDTYSWAGTGPSGAPLPQGRYDLTLESYSDDKLLGSKPVESYGRIIEARGGTNGATVLFAGGIEVAADKITALRAD